MHTRSSRHGLLATMAAMLLAGCATLTGAVEESSPSHWSLRFQRLSGFQVHEFDCANTTELPISVEITASAQLGSFGILVYQEVNGAQEAASFSPGKTSTSETLEYQFRPESGPLKVEVTTMDSSATDGES